MNIKKEITCPCCNKKGVRVGKMIDTVQSVNLGGTINGFFSQDIEMSGKINSVLLD